MYHSVFDVLIWGHWADLRVAMTKAPDADFKVGLTV
jgi:hypothetical protein